MNEPFKTTHGHAALSPQTPPPSITTSLQQMDELNVAISNQLNALEAVAERIVGGKPMENNNTIQSPTSSLVDKMRELTATKAEQLRRLETVVENLTYVI